MYACMSPLTHCLIRGMPVPPRGVDLPRFNMLVIIESPQPNPLAGERCLSGGRLSGLYISSHLSNDSSIRVTEVVFQ